MRSEEKVKRGNSQRMFPGKNRRGYEYHIKCECSNILPPPPTSSKCNFMLQHKKYNPIFTCIEVEIFCSLVTWEGQYCIENYAVNTKDKDGDSIGIYDVNCKDKAEPTIRILC
jgi:hypothetical protein